MMASRKRATFATLAPEGSGPGNLPRLHRRVKVKQVLSMGGGDPNL